MRIDVITIFPDYLAPLDASLLGKARSKGLLQVGVHDLRRWTDDVHRTVDDSPYGGGPGMVMRPEPWGRALDELLGPAGDEEADQTTAAADHTAVADQTADAQRPLLVVPTPSGVPFTQATAARYATRTHLVFACGRYEGIDSRVALDARARMDVEEVSIGDYVLAGGEVAVLVMVEAIARLLPGVLGNAASVVDDSFAAGAMAALIEGPVYTRPPSWRGHEVPAVLLSGDHGAIAAWRREQAVARTAQRRPDLMAPDPLADPVPDGDSERLRRPGVGHQPP